MENCKHINKNGTCGLKGTHAYRHKCYTADNCKCAEPIIIEPPQHGQWIPVAERLPDSFGTYLTCYVSSEYKGNRPIQSISAIQFVPKCGFLINGLHDVTHWMPLPEPPEKEDGR